jgi:hypothetical protein
MDSYNIFFDGAVGREDKTRKSLIQIAAAAKEALMMLRMMDFEAELPADYTPTIRQLVVALADAEAALR